jgi:hypothetical protein
LREILEEASAIIHSDSDAVWLRNPLPLLNRCQSDMVFSQGTAWPPDVHAKYGIVLCCGFFCIRKTDHTLSFISDLEKRARVDGDDQVSLNRILDESGNEWEVSNPYKIPFRDTFFTASREIIRSKPGGPISIAILPHHLVARQFRRMKVIMNAHGSTTFPSAKAGSCPGSIGSAAPAASWLSSRVRVDHRLLPLP